MAYILEDKITCFTSQGLILAIDRCNSGQLNRRHYIDQGQTDLCGIDAQIKARRESYKALVCDVGVIVKKRFVEQDQESARGKGGIAPDSHSNPRDGAAAFGQPYSNTAPVDAEPNNHASPKHVPSGDSDVDNDAELSDMLAKNRAQQEDIKLMAERWRVEKAITEEKMELEAKNQALKRKAMDDDSDAAAKRKRRTIEDDPLAKAEYELKLFQMAWALEREQRDAVESKIKAERIAEEEKAKAANVARMDRIAAKEEKRKADEAKSNADDERHAVYIKVKQEFIGAADASARHDARYKLDRALKTMYPDKSDLSRTRIINSFVRKPNAKS
jgi:hypothetical protein